MRVLKTCRIPVGFEMLSGILTHGFQKAVAAIAATVRFLVLNQRFIHQCGQYIQHRLG